MSRQLIYWRAIFTFSPFITVSFSLGKGHVWDNVYTSACNPWMCKMCELCSLFRTAAAEKCGVLRFGRVGWEVTSNTNKARLWSWRLWKQEKGRGKSREVKAEGESDSIRKKTNSFQPCVCFFHWHHFFVRRVCCLFLKSLFVLHTVRGGLTQCNTTTESACVDYRQPEKKWKIPIADNNWADKHQWG